VIRLQDTSLFKGLDSDTAAAIAGTFLASGVDAGEVVFRQGQEGNALVVVVDGLFELVRDGAEGQEIHLADIQPGRVLGLPSLVDPGPRTATLRALEDGGVAILDLDTFTKLWDAQGDVAAKLHYQVAVIAIDELRSAHRKLLDTLATPLDAPPLLRQLVYQSSAYR